MQGDDPGEDYDQHHRNGPEYERKDFLCILQLALSAGPEAGFVDGVEFMARTLPH